MFGKPVLRPLPSSGGSCGAVLQPRFYATCGAVSTPCELSSVRPYALLCDDALCVLLSISCELRPSFLKRTFSLFYVWLPLFCAVILSLVSSETRVVVSFIQQTSVYTQVLPMRDGKCNS